MHLLLLLAHQTWGNHHGLPPPCHEWIQVPVETLSLPQRYEAKRWRLFEESYGTRLPKVFEVTSTIICEGFRPQDLFMIIYRRRLSINIHNAKKVCLCFLEINPHIFMYVECRLARASDWVELIYLVTLQPVQ